MTNVRCDLYAGLVFFNIPEGPAAAFQRGCVMFFTMLLFELLPFCYVSFYSWDRKFFLADRESGIYATSAYYVAHMCASELCLATVTRVRCLCIIATPWAYRGCPPFISFPLRCLNCTTHVFASELCRSLFSTLQDLHDMRSSHLTQCQTSDLKGLCT